MTYRMTQRIERTIILYLEGYLDREEASLELKRLDLTDEEIACELGPTDDELLGIPAPGIC